MVSARVQTSGDRCQQPWEQSSSALPVIPSSKTDQPLLRSALQNAQQDGLCQDRKRGQDLSEKPFLYDFNSQVQQAEGKNTKNTERRQQEAAALSSVVSTTKYTLI